ncbi:unnamed protein product, partial [Vitis vinifera]|uniref:Uncharacterized protein n=1 Tax=Vitis vinifera TaxID=29760 RepID=D7U314_VITVI
MDIESLFIHNLDKHNKYFRIVETRTLCESRSPKGRVGNFSDRRSECFSLEMENLQPYLLLHICNPTQASFCSSNGKEALKAGSPQQTSFKNFIVQTLSTTKKVLLLKSSHPLLIAFHNSTP